MITDRGQVIVFQVVHEVSEVFGMTLQDVFAGIVFDNAIAFVDRKHHVFFELSLVFPHKLPIDINNRPTYGHCFKVPFDEF